MSALFFCLSAVLAALYYGLKQPDTLLPQA